MTSLVGLVLTLSFYLATSLTFLSSIAVVKNLTTVGFLLEALLLDLQKYAYESPLRPFHVGFYLHKVIYLS